MKLAVVVIFEDHPEDEAEVAETFRELGAVLRAPVNRRGGRVRLSIKEAAEAVIREADVER